MVRNRRKDSGPVIGSSCWETTGGGTQPSLVGQDRSGGVEHAPGVRSGGVDHAPGVRSGEVGQATGNKSGQR